MKRKVIKIDQEKCIGCQLCVNACKESAIGMVNGKATLLRDDYCDGLGNCLPVCPVNAITFEEREAAQFDKKAVLEHQAKSTNGNPPNLPCGCPGTNSRTLNQAPKIANPYPPPQSNENSSITSQLKQWPVQIKLVPVNAPYFEGAHLLIAADCSAFAYGNFHNDFIKKHVTIIGCPKLDEGDYSEKLTEILATNNIKSVTVVRMEVPCCAGIANATITALKNCGKMIPWKVVTISLEGNIIED